MIWATRTGQNRSRTAGFTLIELVLVIVLVGVVATVATRMFSSSLENARYEHTEREMEQLAQAITGNPELYAGGARIDFGYVGDIGALPPNLDALIQNPGYPTWRGPYLVGGNDVNDFRRDAWGQPYGYGGGTIITSTGSGYDIEKELAGSTGELLANSVEGYVVDADNSVPATQQTSLTITLNYPDGSGGTAASTINPAGDGSFAFSGIPIGYHPLKLVYLPDSDTLTRLVSVVPGQTTRISIVFPADIWGI